jgi:hypothetical protein
MTTLPPNAMSNEDDLALYDGIVDIEDLSEAALNAAGVSGGAIHDADELAALGGDGSDTSVPTLGATPDTMMAGNGMADIAPLPLDDDDFTDTGSSSASSQPQDGKNHPANNSIDGQSFSEQGTSSNNDSEQGADVVSVSEQNTTQSDAVKNVSGDDYEHYKILPDASWPPPMYIKRNVNPDERYYMEHRWNSQWSFFDKKATENKNLYHRYQRIIGVGSVAVPVLVGINPVDNLARDLLYFLTVAISLSVAIAAAIENIYKYGDNWRSYRQAAEELKQEKSLYDARAGRYSTPAKPFTSFVERCEEIMAQQNGRWVQSVEKQQTQAAEQVQDILDEYQEDEANTPAGFKSAYAGTNAPSFTQQGAQYVAQVPAQQPAVPPQQPSATPAPAINAPTQPTVDNSANQVAATAAVVANTVSNVVEDAQDYDIPAEYADMVGDATSGAQDAVVGAQNYDIPAEYADMVGDATNGVQNAVVGAQNYDIPAEYADMVGGDVEDLAAIAGDAGAYDVSEYDVPIDDPDMADIG